MDEGILTDPPIAEGNLLAESVDSQDKPQDGLSKRAKKRLLKKEKWLDYRPIKRAKEKERLKLKRKEAKLNNICLGPSRKVMKNYKMSTSNCKIRVCLDFSFDHLMGDKDLNKCVNQMSRCYSNNRRTQNPLQFYVTNFKGPSRTIIQKHSGFNNWDVNFSEKHHLEAFNKDELVYLTSDSDNVIQELKDSEVYVIGALVDHNSHKGLCLKLAEEQGIRHGRLPIDEYVLMKSRRVLTVDHDFDKIRIRAVCAPDGRLRISERIVSKTIVHVESEIPNIPVISGPILLKFDEFQNNRFIGMTTAQTQNVFSILANVACCGLSWKDALLKVLPPRKGVVARDVLPKSDVDESDSQHIKDETTDKDAPS